MEEYIIVLLDRVEGLAFLLDLLGDVSFPQSSNMVLVHMTDAQAQRCMNETERVKGSRAIFKSVGPNHEVGIA